MSMLRFTKWIPDPPSLQRAIKAGHVGIIDGAEGRAYVVSKQCPDRERVLRAINLRETLELTCARVPGAVAGGVALLAIRFLALWLNTL
jgi:hypothetical protein